MTTTLERLSRKLDEQTHVLTRLNDYYAGRQPLAFLAPEAKEALGNRLKALAVNYPRLVVDSLAERLRVEGFLINDAPDPQLWEQWRANGLEDGSAQAHTEALTLGRSFVLVWGREGAPLVTVESATQVQIERDPATREVTAALKRWVQDAKAHAVVFTPEKITRYTSKADVPEGGVVPPTGWNAAESFENPFGMVPVVPILNRGRVLDFDGVSEMADVLDLADALNKIMADAMVTSEYFARPRRYVTGMEIVEEDELDENGNPTGEKVAVNPFASEAKRVWQSENPETRFGQFDPARLDGYADMVATITQQIGALTGLPPHYLGLHGDQPASADAIRSAEASLVARAQARQRTFGQAWQRVAALMSAASTGGDPRRVRAEVVWASAETRTPAQAADAALKLVSGGILPVEQALDDLGYSPDQITRIRAMRRRDALDRVAINPEALVP